MMNSTGGWEPRETRARGWGEETSRLAEKKKDATPRALFGYISGEVLDAGAGSRSPQRHNPYALSQLNCQWRTVLIHT